MLTPNPLCTRPVTYDHIMGKTFAHRWNVCGDCMRNNVTLFLRIFKKKLQRFTCRIKRKGKCPPASSLSESRPPLCEALMALNAFLYKAHASWETPAMCTETSAGSKHGSARIKTILSGADQATSLTPCVSAAFLLATCS